MAKRAVTAGELIDSGAWSQSKDISWPYLTGNGFSCYCKYVLNYGPFRINPNGNGNWCFIKTDYIDEFFTKHLPPINDIVIITHNSDFPITSAYEKYLNHSSVKVWFAQNVDYDHPKLHPLPLGIANGGYAHGDVGVINKVRGALPPKEMLFYVNFTVNNCPTERKYCLEQTGLSMTSKVGDGWNFLNEYTLPNTFENYLTDMAKAYFVIAPRGNGIDCHRIWEALYVNSIPVVTKSSIALAHKDMPILVLDDWKDFKSINFTPELYKNVWNNFNSGDLHMDNYLKRMQSIIDR